MIKESLYLLVGSIVLFGLPGLLAYTGRWRRWTTTGAGSTFRNSAFGFAWIGAGGILLSLAGLIGGLGKGATQASALILALPGFVLIGCGLVFSVWTPRRFLPPWYRERLRSRPLRRTSRRGRS